MKPSNYLKGLYSNPTDEKYTPGYGVLPIIKYIPEGKVIWCPFDTEHSEFVLKFRDAGFKVVYSHICNGQDFFRYEPSQWDVLVSNPPFSRKVEVFDRCLKLGKPFALLMSNYWLNNVAPMPTFPTHRVGTAHVRQTHPVRGREKRPVQQQLFLS